MNCKSMWPKQLVRWSENAVVSLHWWIGRLDDAWCTAVGFAKAKLKLVIFLQQKRLLQFGINGQGHSFTELYIKALFWLKRETSLSAKWINSLPPCYIIWNLKIVIVRENIAKKESYHWRYYLLLATCNRISWILFTLFTVLSQCIQPCSLKLKKKRGKNERVGEKGASKSAFAAGSYDYKQPYNTTILHWKLPYFCCIFKFLLLAS